MGLFCKKYIAVPVIAACLLAGATEEGFSQASSPFAGWNRSGRKLEKGKRTNLLHALHIGYNYVFPLDVKFEHQFAGLNEGGVPVVPKEDIRTVTAKPLLSASIGSYVPIAMINDRNTVALTFGFEAFGYKVDIGTVQPEPGFSYSTTFKQTNYSVPIGVAYKFGGEASFIQEDQISATVGAAIAPSYVIAEYGDYLKKTNFRGIPYLHAELGIFAGIEWKIKASYYPVGMTGFRMGPGDEGMEVFPSESRINISSGPVYQVGLAIMPFSHGWEKRHW